MGLEPAELARWTRFAAKGGIGKCTAICDCVAESADDLMFLKDDEITVLLQLHDRDGCYLGYCEGVVGRFSGSDVFFHSKLKKPVMTRRASTNTTLSVHSISNIPFSPTPTTPTTPTSMETSATRPSSRKMADELLAVSGGGSDSIHGHVSPSNSTASSPTPGSVSQVVSSIAGVNTGQESRRTGALQYRPPSPREFHLGITATNDVPEEDRPLESQSSQAGVSVDESSPSILSSPPSNNIIMTSPPTPPPVSGVLDSLLHSTLTGKEDISASLRPPGSLVNEHDPTTPTAPLRIIKRSPSNPTSPAQSTFSPAATESGNESTLNESLDSSLTPTSQVIDNITPEPITMSLPPVEHISSEADRSEQASALPPLLDTSVTTAESADDDLTTSHPGRFSCFSVGGALTITQLFGTTSHNTSQPISVKEPHDIVTNSPPATLPSKLDGRTSLSIAARGKVDEATLASTQAQVGIGLSLLQDLVGGMSSDSDSDSDYGDSDDEARTEEAKVQARTSKCAENHLSRTVNPIRSSVTPSEGSTVHGLMYADEEDEVQSRKPPSVLSTTPVLHQSPRSLSRYALLQQPPDSFALPDPLVRERERRPSLATSVVSGASGLSRKSGTSGSWDGDIYDNYRYSTFSVGSSMTGVGRPSMDSTRPRTESVSVAGRMRLDGPIEDVAEEAESADPTCVENQSSNVVDVDASFYSQDSRLSTLSNDISSLAANDSTTNRPSPLSIPALQAYADQSPLLHTDWASPTSPSASAVQTALPLPTASVYSPHLRQSNAAGVPKVENTALSLIEDNRKEDEERQATGMASTMRKLLEADRRTPLSNEMQTSSEIEPNDNSVSFTSPGLGQAIVVDDDEELPSRILENGDDSEHYDPDNTFLESREGNSMDNPAAPPNRKEVETDVDQDQSRPGPEPASPRALLVSNRTPAGMLGEDGGNTPPSSNSTQFRESNLSSPPRLQSHLSQQLSPQRQLPSDSNISHLRTRNNDVMPQRRSLFLPHPNAPKAPADAPLDLEPGAGVGVISRPYPARPYDVAGGGPPLPPSRLRPPVQVVIRMALSMPPRTTILGPGKPPVQILPTIYGRTEVDLTSSIRPVPIIFSVDPPPPNIGGGKATAPRGAVLPPIGAGGSRLNHQGSPPRRPSTTQALSDLGSSLLVVPNSPTPNAPRPSSLASEGKDKTSTDNILTPKTEKETTVDEDKLKPSPPNGSSPIPRPNFTPKVPGLRPRSRSFSGFNSSVSTPSLPLPSGEKHEPTNNGRKRTISSSALSPPGLKRPAKPSRPSPLSVSSINSTDRSSQPPSSPLIFGSAPSTPLARNTFVSLPPSPSPSTTINPSSLGTGYLDRSPLNTKLSRPTLGDALQPGTGTADVSAATLRPTNTTVNPQTVTIGGKSSFEGATKQAAGTGVGRQSSLRSKLSLPNLRRNRTRDDATLGVYDRDTNERRPDRPKEMMQVRDMEFELVRPNLSLLQAQQRTSDDSMNGRPDNSAESRVDSGGLLRSESPVSLNSGYRSPVLEMRDSTNGSGLNVDAGMTPVGQSNDSIEAHRQRETKWVSLMSSSPASLSRKSKKVKKLLVDGVPSSVRYLIWSYLTDGKGRAVKGVYDQLCQRGGVVRTRDIVADADRLFGGDTGNDGMQYLHATKGTITVLLQAYFCMVPDVQYTTGLTKIVGQLLLLGPEEDAFWIFTSMMDTHIRPYFTVPAPTSSSTSTPIPRSTQMEVDAALYSRALEALDPIVAKKIFVDLGILPGALCHSWFTSLFVGTLPPDCVNRVWDIFLYEGIPFLLRVALSLTIICRKFILSSTTNSESAVLTTLARPPPQWLPPTPEAFLTLAFNVKLKDDDIRKQRIKMGEQVKRQTQAQQGSSSVTLGGISLPSLSRI